MGRRLPHDLIADLWAQGMTSREIGAMPDVRAAGSTVDGVINRLRARGDRRCERRGRSARQRLAFVTPADVRAALDDAARVRRMTAPNLALALVAAAARDRIIDAILDDGVES